MKQDHLGMNVAPDQTINFYRSFQINNHLEQQINRTTTLDLDQSKARLDDQRGFVGWAGIGMDGYHRSQVVKSIFGANNENGETPSETMKIA